MEKLDLVKKYKSYYTAPNHPQLLEIEAAQFLAIAGKGDPSSTAFAETILALYSTAYHLKFTYKALDKDYVVSKLEAQWWYDEEKFKVASLANTPLEIPRSEWHFRLLLRLPDFIKSVEVKKSVQEVVSQKGIFLASQVELFELHEGKSVQMMHLGPFKTEPETLEKIKQYCSANQLERNGLHHEIYLSDFRKTAPEKLKTILREPVK